MIARIAFAVFALLFAAVLAVSLVAGNHMTAAGSGLVLIGMTGLAVAARRKADEPPKKLHHWMVQGGKGKQ